MNKNSKIVTIIKHEYMIKFKSKGFIIGTFLGPLGFLLIIFLIAIVTYFSMDSNTKKIAIVDNSNLNIASSLIKSDTTKYFLSNLPETKLSEKVAREEIDGYMIIPKDILENNQVKVITRGGGGLVFAEQIESDVNYFIRLKKLDKYGFADSLIREIEKRVTIESEKINEAGETEKDFAEAYASLGYVLGFIIYMFMFIYGSFVSRGVIEEKSNRIIEVIASSAKPFEIMMGKILGIALLGLTQVIFWIILLLGLLYFAQPLIMNLLANPEMMQQGLMTQQQVKAQEAFQVITQFANFGIIIAFIFYFLSGYFIYSTLFAAIGSAVDQESDAQQLMLPISMLIIIPMMFIYVVMSNPDSTASVILSLVPFFAPILMIVRIAATNVPFWQIAISVILIILTFLTSVWIASRIYRVGILMYGKKPTFKELYKWIKIS